MDSWLSLEFFNKIKKLEGREYLIALIRFHAAATLEGKKPSSLISFNRNRVDLYSLWMTYKYEMHDLLKIEYFELERNKDRELVLFYKPCILEETIKHPDNMEYLQELGYGSIADIKSALNMLKDRLTFKFPHEIGIFLGIPREDVDGFIKNTGMNFIINGYWKVYSNPERAVKAFNEYDNARISIMRKIIEGL